MNSADVSSIVSKHERSMRVFTENLYTQTHTITIMNTKKSTQYSLKTQTFIIACTVKHWQALVIQIINIIMLPPKIWSYFNASPNALNIISVRTTLFESEYCRGPEQQSKEMSCVLWSAISANYYGLIKCNYGINDCPFHYRQLLCFYVSPHDFQIPSSLHANVISEIISLLTFPF